VQPSFMPEKRAEECNYYLPGSAGHYETDRGPEESSKGFQTTSNRPRRNVGEARKVIECGARAKTSLGG